MNFSHTSEAHATVMGPEYDLSPSNIFIPPKLRTDTDKLQWREAVYEWADTLIGCATAGDNRSKGAVATLGMTLYRSLEFSEKEVVKKAVRIGELIIAPKENEREIDQREVVKKILNLVTKDSNVDRLRRTVRLYKSINACKRKLGEAIGDYVERFAGLAFSYLNQTNSDQDSTDSQNFGIVLLLNANLSTQTFANIISNLVASSKMKNTETVQTIQVSSDRVSTIIELLNRAISKDIDDEAVGISRECLRTLKAAVQEHRKACDNDERSSRIGLQDAIQALQEIGIEEKSTEESASEAPETEVATKSFLTTNKFNKRTKRRKRFSQEDDEEPAKRDTRPVQEEPIRRIGITSTGNHANDKNSVKFKKNRSENHHEKKDNPKPFFR